MRESGYIEKRLAIAHFLTACAIEMSTWWRQPCRRFPHEAGPPTPGAVQEIIAFPTVVTLRYSELTEGAGKEIIEGNVLFLILARREAHNLLLPPRRA